MGKVRTEMVKRVAIELINKYPKSFNIDFDHNKKIPHRAQHRSLQEDEEQGRWVRH